LIGFLGAEAILLVGDIDYKDNATAWEGT